jgi:peptidoglycan/xylan/chitin deacetylase (PgdA/CDA1 family)
MKREALYKWIYRSGMGSWLHRQKKNRLTVLSLHRIADEEDFFWQPIHPQRFEELLQYLIPRYQITNFASLGETQEKQSHKKPPLILSFDDGYRDFYTHALPILSQYKLTANHNIVNECAGKNAIIWTQRLNTLFSFCKNNHLSLSIDTGAYFLSLSGFNDNWIAFYLHTYNHLLRLPKPQRMAVLQELEQKYSIAPEVKMMTWDEVRECASNGIEIGSHTYSHDVLSTIGDKNMLRHEIIDSIQEMNTQLNQQTKVLALPNGEAHPLIKQAAGEAGLKHILYVGEQINPLAVYRGNDIWDSYRINLVQESLPGMILRTELFHTKMRKYV